MANPCDLPALHDTDACKAAGTVAETTARSEPCPAGAQNVVMMKRPGSDGGSV